MKETQDLRSFIDRLESMGEIKTIEGADWNLEIGGLTELLSEKRGPALLFDRIKDYPPGYPNPSCICPRTRHEAARPGAVEWLAHEAQGL